MGNNKETGSVGGSIILNGSILAIAQIITRLIGLFYRIPLQRIAGDVAMGYYGYAFDIYMTLLLFSSNGVPVAVSKLVANAKGKNDARNEYRILKSALILTFAIGAIVGIGTFVFAEQITDFLYGSNMRGVVPALRVLAPTIFLCCVMSTIRGYMQGIGTSVPTAVSQIFEQIANAIVSVAAAYLLVSRGAAYAAMGGTLGTCIGALVSTIFLFGLYIAYRPRLMRRVRLDKKSKPIPYSQIYTLLAVTLGPMILSSVIFQISGIIDSSLYSTILTDLGYEADLISSLYGIYTSKYKILINVPMALAAALGISVVPDISASMVSGNMDEIRDKIHLTVKFCMLIAIPATVGLSVLGGPIMMMLFGDNSALTVRLITIGTPYLLFYSLATVTIGVLQGIDKMRVPIYNSGIALVIHTVFIYILLKFCNMNIYAIMYSNILFGFILSLLNHLCLKKFIGYRQEIKETFVLPSIASVVMGFATFVTYKGLYRVLHINIIATMIAIFVAMIVYAVVLIRLGGISEKEIYAFPKGAVLVRVLKKCHVL